MDESGSSLLSSETAQGVLTKDTMCPSLPAKYRFWGFVICFLLGILFSLLATIVFMIGGGAVKFALIFTLGNICSVASTFFMIGPCKQLKVMFKKKRIISTLMFLGILIFTLIFVFAIYNDDKAGHKIIIWILVGLQYVASIWYVLSYIPCAQKIVMKCCSCLCAD
jgi:hypothetical protein